MMEGSPATSTRQRVLPSTTGKRIFTCASGLGANRSPRSAQLELETVRILILDPLQVRLDADRILIVMDADQKRSARAVEVRAEGLQAGVQHLFRDLRLLAPSIGSSHVAAWIRRFSAKVASSGSADR